MGQSAAALETCSASCSTGGVKHFADADDTLPVIVLFPFDVLLSWTLTITEGLLKEDTVFQMIGQAL